MGICYNCGKKLTLKEEEIKCDFCGKVVNYNCWNCGKWFLVADDNGKKRDECGVCGYFYCPDCKVCGDTCNKKEWIIRLKEIGIINIDMINKIINLIEEIKIGKDRRICPNGVSISYAKGRNKRCAVRMAGYGVKNEEDLNKFKQRYDKISDVELGTKLTINQNREAGSYGQEYRDAFNYAVCRGKLKKIKVKQEINNETIEYETYVRIEEGQCPQLDLTKLIIKVCKNPKCPVKEFPLKEEECCYCRYKKGTKKGKFYPLKIKISNKDICQLNRGDFKKDGEG